MYLLLVDHNFIASSELQEMINQISADREIVNCYSQETLLKVAGKISPDLVIVDFDLIKGDQSSFFKSLHDKKIKAHIMVLINPDHYADLHSAIETGVIDDYMVKPVQKEDFIARVKLAVLREKQPAVKEDLPVWSDQQEEKKEPDKPFKEDFAAPDYKISETDAERYRVDESLDREEEPLETGPDYESESSLRGSDLTEKDFIEPDEYQQKEPAEEEPAVEKEPLTEKWAGDELNFEPRAQQEHEEAPEKSSFIDDFDLLDQKEDLDLEEAKPWNEEEPDFGDLKLEQDEKAESIELFDEPEFQEEHSQASDLFDDQPGQQKEEPSQDQDQEDLLSLFDDVDSIFNSKSGAEDEIFTPDRGTGVFEKADPDSKPSEDTKEQTQPDFEPPGDLESEFGEVKPSDELFDEPVKKSPPRSASPLPEEKRLFDDLFEDDRGEVLKEEPKESFADSGPDFKKQSTFGKDDFMDLPSEIDDEALFSPEAEEGLEEFSEEDFSEEDFFKEEPRLSSEEIRRRSALPGRSADDFLFGENNEKEPVPDLPDWIDEQVEYDWRKDLETREEDKEEFKDEVREADQADLDQERDVSRRKRKSRSSPKRFFSISGNILFVLLLIFMAGLSFLLIQSRIAGGVPQVAGYQMYIVLSGSMNPEFDTGSLAFVRDVEPLQLREGDIITFESPNNPASLTTHRIVEIQREDGLKFITRGDANNVNDPSPVPADNVVGMVTGTVPYVGYVLNFAQTTQGLVLLIFIPGILIILFELSKIVRYLSQGEGPGRRKRESDYRPIVDSER